jgi:hypothetical protein
MYLGLPSNSDVCHIPDLRNTDSIKLFFNHTTWLTLDSYNYFHKVVIPRVVVEEEERCATRHSVIESPCPRIAKTKRIC